MINIRQADLRDDRIIIRALFEEHLTWVIHQISKRGGGNPDIEVILNQDMSKLDSYGPPNGRILLAYQEDEVAGMACLRQIQARVGEIKRMYVRPSFRRNGIAQRLIEVIATEAINIGYEFLRLDSAQFMTAAQALYRSYGFNLIEPYEGSDVPASAHDKVVFMEKRL